MVGDLVPHGVRNHLLKFSARPRQALVRALVNRDLVREREAFENASLRQRTALI
jgi:hypothetical protein